MVKKKIKKGIRIVKYVAYKETLVNFNEQLWSFLGAFIGLCTISFLQSFSLPYLENIFLIGSFGASCVLIFGAIHSPLAQPRNLIGGHLISSFTGVTVSLLFPDILWLIAPLAVSLSIILMQITKTLHPPGGATALIFVTGSEKIKSLGYLYMVTPVLAGCLILLTVALIFNNLTPNRKYPTDRRFTRFFKLNKRKNFVVNEEAVETNN